MMEIKIWGRGGQGAITTGQIIAIAAFYDGKQCQTFPSFGVEREGAPLQAFVRISDEKINLRSQVYNPDVVMILEPSLIDSVDTVKGLKKKGSVIVNTNKKKRELGIKGDFQVHTVDATKIALQIFAKPIVNTPIIGAFAKVTNIVTIKSLNKAVDEVFERKGKKITELNKKAILEVYNSTK